MKTESRLQFTCLAFRALAGAVFCMAGQVSAQMIEQTLISFGIDFNPGAGSQAPLILGADGFLFGTTLGGGSEGAGTIFRIHTNGRDFVLLHDFTCSGSDGVSPRSPLVQGQDGALYGTATKGGSEGFGTIFRLLPNGKDYAVLHSFGDVDWDGQTPYAGLVQGKDGALYGTTVYGGTSTNGTVFKLKPDGTGYQILHSFSADKAEGASPYAGVLVGSDGALYGTTYGDLRTGTGGTVFRLNPDGTGFTVIRTFTGSVRAGLVEAVDGSLYGASTSGRVFKMDKNGTDYTVVGEVAAEPNSALIFGNDGWLYGMTRFGGDITVGSIFKISPDGTDYVRLWSFPEMTNGAHPIGGLVQAGDGTLYGTTSLGGSGRCGTVFRLNPDGTGLAALHHFSAYGGSGFDLLGDLVSDKDGALYGVSKPGSVFRLSRDGTGYSKLRAFGSLTGDASAPCAGLVQGKDGALYGTTEAGGIHNCGAVYKLNPDGTGYRVIHSFGPRSDPLAGGISPQAALIEGKDGALYGTTMFGGTRDGGTAFRIHPDGTGHAVLHNFGDIDGWCAFASARLVQVSEGTLYGTVMHGGTLGGNTVFSLNPDGSGFAVLHSFSNSEANEYALGLVADQGALYGVTRAGGSSMGKLFRLNFDGSDFAVLHHFGTLDEDGLDPDGELILADDGVLVGTTSQGGRFGKGTIFQINTDGSGYAVVYHFGASPHDGGSPRGALVGGNDGALYGTTRFGGSQGSGTVFRVLSPDQFGTHPPQLASPRHRLDGLFQFSVRGIATLTYRIETSADPSNWLAITNVSSASGISQFIDLNAPNSAQRFYRAVWVP